MEISLILFPINVTFKNELINGKRYYIKKYIFVREFRGLIQDIKTY